jgi:endo-1,4-beta-xylanase
VSGDHLITRRSFVVGCAGAAAGLIGCSPQRPRAPASSPSTPAPASVECAALDDGGGASALWESALRRGLVYGSSTATWQVSDEAYARLFAREAAILFTEDDLLWYRLRPTPQSGLRFEHADEIVGFAHRHGMLVLGAHLVWDDGFGDGWTSEDLLGLSAQGARGLLFGTVSSVVRRYRGRVAAWIVVNEAVNATGLRSDVPWYTTIGPSYVADSFRVAHDADSNATLVLNGFGFETDDGSASAADKRAATLRVLDELLDANVPVDALGVQAHLQANPFLDSFDEEAYRRFLSAVASRGLKILITEMDVLDDGLPAAVDVRDRAVAEAYRRYLGVALDEPAVVSLTTFGLSDRYTWLEEDYPRTDGAPRRPLPFDDRLRPKPAYRALNAELDAAALRAAFWTPPRC